MSTTLRLAFTGDICLGAGAFEHVGERALPSLLRPFGELFARHDLVVGNLECVLLQSDAASALMDTKMAVSVARAAGLHDSGFSVLTLANNHVLDCGRQGLAWTIEELDRQGIASSGAGVDLESAVTPLRITRSGRRITFITACDYSAHFATAKRAGIAPLEATRLLDQVDRAREGSDLIVVILHADLEFSDYPAPWRVALARQFVDAGAHVVVQHHPHVFQGYERYRTGMIAYSLGNFVFKIQGNAYQERYLQTGQGLVLSLDVEFDGGVPRIEAQFVPIRIGADHFPQLVSGTDAAAIMTRLEALSKGLRDPDTIRAAWRKRCRDEARRWAYSAYYAARRGRLGAAARDLWSALAVAEDRRWLSGWLTRGAR